jgi:hypothetical protein
MQSDFVLIVFHVFFRAAREMQFAFPGEFSWRNDFESCPSPRMTQATFSTCNQRHLETVCASRQLRDDETIYRRFIDNNLNAALTVEINFFIGSRDNRYVIFLARRVSIFHFSQSPSSLARPTIHFVGSFVDSRDIFRRRA